MAPFGPMPGRTPTRVPRSTPARASKRNVGSAKEAKPPPRSLSTAVPSLHEPEAARGQGNEQPVDEDEPRGCAKCCAQQHRLQHTGHSHDLGYRDNGARESDDETCGVGQQRDCESGEWDARDARQGGRFVEGAAFIVTRKLVVGVLFDGCVVSDAFGLCSTAASGEYDGRGAREHRSNQKRKEPGARVCGCADTLLDGSVAVEQAEHEQYASGHDFRDGASVLLPANARHSIASRTGAEALVLSRRCCVASSGPTPLTTRPSFSAASPNLSLSMASENASSSCSATSSGKPSGAMTMLYALQSMSTPWLANVFTSGTRSTGFAEVMPSARTLPDFSCGREIG